MGTLGRKIDKVSGLKEFNRIRNILMPNHCNLGIDNILLAGSLRRGKQSDIGDIDVIIVTTDGKISPKIAPLFKDNGYQINAAGSALIRMLNEDEVQTDIYSCSEEQLPMMLAYLTGPQEYNIQMRLIAKKRGFKLNQIALMTSDGEVEVTSERHLFNILGCEYIEPENRINFYDSLKYHKIG